MKNVIVTTAVLAMLSAGSTMAAASTSIQKPAMKSLQDKVQEKGVSAETETKIKELQVHGDALVEVMRKKEALKMEKHEHKSAIKKICKDATEDAVKVKCHDIRRSFDELKNDMEAREDMIEKMERKHEITKEGAQN